MGFPDEPLSMNPLMEQWEKNQAIQGRPIEAAPAPDPISAPSEGHPGLAVPPPPSAGIEVTGLPSYLTNPESVVPSPEQQALFSGTQSVTATAGTLTGTAATVAPPESEPVTAVTAEPQVEPETTQAVIYQRGLSLAAVSPEDTDLVWKVACKTGTLALSPGPGQTDAETPLQLTPDLFNDMKQSFDEKAFPYVTVPETHANGALENTGYVRAVDVLDHNQALTDNRIPERFRPQIEADPADTQYLLTGVEFTEPEVREKALRGTIPDTSIGVKFNYRNKRSGKNYKAAFEHLALTPVPWVDGLVPFGLSQQDGVYDAETQVLYDGVYTEIELSPLKSKTRNALPDSAFAIPEERKFPIHDESHARNALSRCSGTKYEARVRAAVKKRYPNIGVNTSVDEDEGEGMELAVIHFDPAEHPRDFLGKFRAAVGNLNLGDKVELPDGASVRKGQEGFYVRPATSPGVGVAIPPTNDPVKAADAILRDSELVGRRGEIPDTLEGPQGRERSLRSVGRKTGIPDKSTKRRDYVPQRSDYVQSSNEYKRAGLPKWALSQEGADEDGATLSSERDPARIPPTDTSLSVESETEENHMPRTVEEILAEERAAREAAEARLAEMEQNLSLAQGTISSQGEQLHITNVEAKVRSLQGKVPPVLLLAAKRIYEADKPGVQSAGLELSVQTPVTGDDGKPGLAELKLDSATKIVDYLLASAPAISGEQAVQIATVFDGIDNLTLAQDPGAEDDSEAAKIKQVEDYEREMHPERFADNGKGERL